MTVTNIIALLPSTIDCLTDKLNTFYMDTTPIDSYIESCKNQIIATMSILEPEDDGYFSISDSCEKALMFLKQIKTESETIIDELFKITEERNSFKDNAETWESKYDDKVDDLEQSEKQIKQLEDDLSDRDDEILKLHDEVNSKDYQLSQKDDEISRLETDLRDLQYKLDRLL